jgi:hypothetical protein
MVKGMAGLGPLLVMTLLLTACPASSGHAPEEVCAKVGQTCKLDKGLLGVCTTGTLDCDGAPCLVCMGQH